MRNLIASFVFLFFTTSVLAAHELLVFELEIPESYSTEVFMEDLDGWRLSLLKGLGYEENQITEAIFLKTDISLKIDDLPIIGQVYQNKDVQNQFYILASNTIIDFNLQKVGSMGVAGITQHPTPSKRMVIILAPQVKTNLLGVTIDFTGKVQVSPPVFKSRQVSYEWYAW